MKLRQKTEAIIFKKKHLLNKDFLITVFTENFGKIYLLAKGIKKITSKRLAIMETGNLVKIVIEKRKTGQYLLEISLISGFSKIKENKDKIKIFYQFLFILDRLLADNQKEKKIYNLLKIFLIELSKKKFLNEQQEEEFLNDYLNKTLFMMGYINKKHSLKKIKLIIKDLINDDLILRF